MPAIRAEVEAALEEGIRIEVLAAPVEILCKNGHVVGVKCIRMELGEPDASGRPRPLPVSGSEFHIEATSERVSQLPLTNGDNP